MDNRQIDLQYGNQKITLTLPAQNINQIMNLKDSRKINIENNLLRNLVFPNGKKSLKEEVSHNESVLIVCDDNTRPTPKKKILPIIIQELIKGGVKKKNIQILIANGTHRFLNDEEIKGLVGKFIYDNISVINHDAKNKENLKYMGETQNGTPIYVNKLVFENDFVIGVGCIVPHRYCGWSGGGKIIQPGVSGVETTEKTHLMLTQENNDIKLGQIDNVVRREIDQIAKKAGLDFIVNVVLNSNKEIVKIVTGDPIKAHKEGVEYSKKICGVKIKSKSDVVIISAYPADLNFWQAGKAIYTADLVVNNGGLILLVSPLVEGIGEHPEFISLIGEKNKKIKKFLTENKIKDKISAAGAYAVNLVTEKAEVILVSDGLNSREMKNLSFKKILPKDLQAYIDQLLRKKKAKTFTIVKEGPEILPLLSD